VLLAIFSPLGCYAALIDSYRRFGSTYPSHFQGLLDPWKWDRRVVRKRL